MGIGGGDRGEMGMGYCRMGMGWGWDGMGWNRDRAEIYCTTCTKPNKTPHEQGKKKRKKNPSLTLTITRLLASGPYAIALPKHEGDMRSHEP